ncbi:MAG: cytochrome o ubiquinol oxidase subunit IV [Halioglobus sp.]|nr:cytochrome o ubiquinol oxidase subunit IV [Halioglobus sp.]
MQEKLDYAGELQDYLKGFALALLLTLIPFGMVAWSALPRFTLLIAIGVCGLLQVVVQFHYFLHINLSREKREDLWLILFSILLLSIMAGGTIWIMANLAHRMH